MNERNTAEKDGHKSGKWGEQTNDKYAAQQLCSFKDKRNGPLTCRI